MASNKKFTYQLRVDLELYKTISTIVLLKRETLPQWLREAIIEKAIKDFDMLDTKSKEYLKRHKLDLKQDKILSQRRRFNHSSYIIENTFSILVSHAVNCAKYKLNPNMFFISENIRIAEEYYNLLDDKLKESIKDRFLILTKYANEKEFMSIIKTRSNILLLENRH